MAFDPNKPAHLDALESQPVRDNMTSLASFHAGGTAPTSPSEGWAWLDTSAAPTKNLKMYLGGTWITILSNVQAGPPSQSNVDKHVFSQSVGVATWVISHALGTTELSVAVLDSSNQVMIPDTITMTDNATVTITFVGPQTGKAILLG